MKRLKYLNSISLVVFINNVTEKNVENHLFLFIYVFII